MKYALKDLIRIEKQKDRERELQEEQDQLYYEWMCDSLYDIDNYGDR